MFITAELIKLICEKTWVQCQFQWNIGALRSLGKLSLRTDAQILNWPLVVQNSRAKENHKMTLIRLRNLSQGTKKVKKKTLNQIICWFFLFDAYFGNLQVWGPNLQVFLDFFSKPPDLHVMGVGRSAVISLFSN